jgi:1,4-dihydroxy-2-naphthoyl-CoA synthase
MSDHSKYETIKVEKANRVATVTLNRPDSLNAVNPVLHRELCTIWLDLAVDEEVNAIILTGRGPRLLRRRRRQGNGESCGHLGWQGAHAEDARRGAPHR